LLGKVARSATTLLGCLPTWHVVRQRPVLSLAICGWVVLAAVITASALVLADLRGRAIADAKRELQNTALVLAEEIDNALQAVDLLQAGLFPNYLEDASYITIQILSRIHQYRFPRGCNDESGRAAFDIDPIYLQRQALGRERAGQRAQQ